MRVLKVLIFLLAPLAVGLATWGYLNSLFSVAIAPRDPSTVLFEIPPQQNLKSVARNLQEQGFIRHAWAFNLMAQLKKKDTAIRAGEFELSRSMTPEDILNRIVNGPVFGRRVTVKEGASIREIGSLVEQAKVASKVEFDAALDDQELLKTTGVRAQSFEGYLFPDTYEFTRNTPPAKVIQAMVARFNQAWSPEYEDRAANLKMSRHEILTLASIVEKESGNAKEQPLIASVFHNRLKRGMRLQADPTVIYGIANFNGNITKEDLLAPTAYNTYVIDGLPPGPIANPGASAIRATLYPLDTGYLYFVADGTGNHVFSEDLGDHNKAVNEHQKSPAKR